MFLFVEEMLLRQLAWVSVVAAAVTEVLAVLALRGPFGQFLRWLRLFAAGVRI